MKNRLLAFYFYERNAQRSENGAPSFLVVYKFTWSLNTQISVPFCRIENDVIEIGYQSHSQLIAIGTPFSVSIRAE